MKKKLAFIVLFGALMVNLQAIAPYLLVGNVSGTIETVEASVVDVLKSSGFEILGSYNPGGNQDQLVIAYTSKELVSQCINSGGRRILAAPLKVGLRKQGGNVEVSMLNPEYLFYAYMRDKMDDAGRESKMLAISSQAVAAMKKIGTDMTPFGGDLSKKELKDYKYMVGMPKFDDPVLLKEFESFQKGLNTITKNLEAGKGNTVKVYGITDPGNEIAIIGVGLLDPDKGEGHFLPIIGEENIAAMPYEIVLNGNKATILHGRFRFASHWPELTMGTFTKIMSSPGDVEEMLKGLTE